MKQHLQTLDGMRGIAAVSVVLFHIGRWLDATWIASNASLAVDLFFCLSGYVLPLAYWRRRAILSNTDFFRLRAIRLMPLIVLGALISLAYVVLKLRTSHLAVPPGMIATAAVGSLLDIPTWGAAHEIGGPMVFPLNGPQYTLFLELVANLVWWALRKTAGGFLVGGVIALCTVLLLIFGIGGDTVDNFYQGFPRVALSFCLGLALYFLRGRYRPNPATNRVVFAVAGAASLIFFYIPISPPRWVEVLWIVLAAPALVLSGARVTLHSTGSRIALSLGALSYPVYALHYPIFCWVNGVYRSAFGAQNLLVEAPLDCLIIILVAYGALLIYDEPIRRWLSNALEAPMKRPSLSGDQPSRLAP